MASWCSQDSNESYFVMGTSVSLLAVYSTLPNGVPSTLGQRGDSTLSNGLGRICGSQVKALIHAFLPALFEGGIFFVKAHNVALCSGLV